MEKQYLMPTGGSNMKQKAFEIKAKTQDFVIKHKKPLIVSGVGLAVLMMYIRSQQGQGQQQ
jgi:hypothetical protein